jgi:hypothetical protein
MQKTKTPEAVKAQSPNGDAPQFKSNPKVDEKIDTWIKDNPERWKFFRSLPPERMGRMLVLNEVNNYERRQKMNNGILKKLEQNPEAKAAYETLVKSLPEDQRERAMISIARQTMRVTAPRPAQAKAQAPAVGVGM